MFYQERYQTGEIKKIISDMQNGLIPCMDVDDSEELNWFIGQLQENGLYKVSGQQYDVNARDRVKEPEFEYRISFYSSPITMQEAQDKKLMFLDVYFEPIIDRTYDPCGEM